MTQEELGARIREIRKKHGLTCEKLADGLHVSQSTLYMQERGERGIPGEMVKRVADYFSISTDEFFTGNPPESYEINRDIGLTDPAITALRKLKAEDTSGQIMEGLNKALSDIEFLNNLVTFLQIKSPERGYHFGTCSPEKGFYLVEMSPDTYAQAVLLSLNQQLERMRTGDEPKTYAPQIRRNEKTVEDLRQAGRLIERGEDNAEEK